MRRLFLYFNCGVRRGLMFGQLIGDQGDALERLLVSMRVRSSWASTSRPFSWVLPVRLRYWCSWRRSSAGCCCPKWLYVQYCAWSPKVISAPQPLLRSAALVFSFATTGNLAADGVLSKLYASVAMASPRWPCWRRLGSWLCCGGCGRALQRERRSGLPRATVRTGSASSARRLLLALSIQRGAGALIYYGCCIV